MWKEIKKKLSNTESLISLALGVIIVVVAGVLLFNVVKNKTMSGKTEVQTSTDQSSTSESITENTLNNTDLPAKYTVKEGDDLWGIAVTYYKSGYNWVDIAKENRLIDANVIVTGQELTIPKVEPIMTGGSVNGDGMQTLKGDSYTVAKGDTLWDISCRAYSDCYKYVEIANANNLTNPSVIEVGQDLKLPR